MKAHAKNGTQRALGDGFFRYAGVGDDFIGFIRSSRTAVDNAEQQPNECNPTGGVISDCHDFLWLVRFVGSPAQTGCGVQDRKQTWAITRRRPTGRGNCQGAASSAAINNLDNGRCEESCRKCGWLLLLLAVLGFGYRIPFAPACYRLYFSVVGDKLPELGMFLVHPVQHPGQVDIIRLALAMMFN